jgi:hypothetical protein
MGYDLAFGELTDDGTKRLVVVVEEIALHRDPFG